MIDPKILIDAGRNTIVYEGEESIEAGARGLRDLLCCLPRVEATESLTWRNVFRTAIMQFIDSYSS